MRKTILVNLIFIFCLTLACSRKKVSTENTPKWIRMVLPYAITQSDWTTCESPACFQHAALVMEGLTRLLWNEGDLKVEASLAESWVVSDKNTLKLTLRSNVLWSNGSVLTAKDFTESWKLLLSSKNEKQASLFFSIQNAKAYFDKKVPFESVGIRAPDKNTLILRLNSNPAQFLNRLAHPASWPSFNGSRNPAITLGPFVAAPMKLPNRITYVRNAGYWGPLPSLDGIEVLASPDPKMRANLFADHEVELADDIPLEYWARSREAFSLKPSFGSLNLLFNPQKKPFTATEIRDAFIRSIDRAEWNDLLHLPILLQHSLDPLRSDLNPTKSFPQFNPLEARAILTTFQFDAPNLRFTEEGHVRPFSKITLAYLKNGILDEIALNLQAQWLKNLEVKVELHPVADRKALAELSFIPSMVLLPVAASPFLPLHGLEHLDSLASPFFLHPGAGKIPDSSLGELQVSLLGKSSLLYPLFKHSKILLQSERLRNLMENSVGVWDLRVATLDG